MTGEENIYYNKIYGKGDFVVVEIISPWSEIHFTENSISQSSEISVNRFQVFPKPLC